MAKTKVITTTTSGVSANRIKNDAVFERTRENAAEFGRAGKAAKFTRVVFRECMINAKDPVTQARLLKVFSRIISTDPVNGRGERKVKDGDIKQLLNFNFNARAGIRDMFYKDYDVSFDRVTGLVQVTIPGYVPKVMVDADKGTSNFLLMLGAAIIDYEKEEFKFFSFRTPEIPWTHTPVPDTTLSVSVPANSTQDVAVVLGIEYFDRLNGASYPLKSGSYNAATIILVDRPA